MKTLYASNISVLTGDTCNFKFVTRQALYPALAARRRRDFYCAGRFEVIIRAYLDLPLICDVKMPKLR